MSATRLTSPVRQGSKVSFVSPASERHVSVVKYRHVKPKHSEKSFKNAYKNKSPKSQNVNFWPFNLVAFRSDGIDSDLWAILDSAQSQSGDIQAWCQREGGARGWGFPGGTHEKIDLWQHK